jgi:hypothetical protein
MIDAGAPAPGFGQESRKPSSLAGAFAMPRHDFERLGHCQTSLGFVLDHDHFRSVRLEVINVIAVLYIARDRTENRYPLFLITR